MDSETRTIPWLLYGAELMGTALLVSIGLSIVILALGQGSPLVQLIPNAGERRLLTGFLFGTTGALIALSLLGKESGAHINPAVTLAFWLTGKLQAGHAIGYLLSQLIGAALGALPLLAWGEMGRSVAFGATLPGQGYGLGMVMLGETITTFLLIAGLFVFLRHRRLRPFTPALFPILYAAMVYLEAPVSGTSTNPARSLGPELISGDWQGWWLYWLGPVLGTLLGVAVFRLSGAWLKIEVAKLYHFGHDRYGVFHREGGLKGRP
jgi:aquaporin Z